MQFIKYHQNLFPCSHFLFWTYRYLVFQAILHANITIKKKTKKQTEKQKKSYSVIEAPNNTAITWKIAADPNTKNISFKTWTICKMTNKMIIHIVYGIYEVL